MCSYAVLTVYILTDLKIEIINRCCNADPFIQNLECINSLCIIQYVADHFIPASFHYPFTYPHCLLTSSFM